MESKNENLKKGFICLYRSVKDHWLWSADTKKSKFQAWIDLLLSANHDPYKEPVGYDLIELKRGQILTSQDKLSKDWKWDRSAIRHFLGQLRKDGIIEIRTSSKFTILTICNYDSYNSLRPTKNQRDNNKTTTTQHIQPLEPLEPLVNGADAPKKNKEENFKKWDKEAFINDIKETSANYDGTTKNNFFKYWSEKGPNGKMRFQLEKTWETEKRLSTWQRNDQNWTK